MMRYRTLVGRLWPALWAAASSMVLLGSAAAQATAASPKPHILVIFGDDVGVTNISAYSSGVMGYETPNIDRLAPR